MRAAVALGVLVACTGSPEQKADSTPVDTCCTEDSPPPVDSDTGEPCEELSWYADLDSDGYGDATHPTSSCTQPEGAVADATDCDDTDDAVHPGATDPCNTVDDDCDGETDEDADATTWHRDGDGDGHGHPTQTLDACTQPEGYVASSDDCDDGDADRYPGAPELCDGEDGDCDGDATDDPVTDADGDGHGATDCPSGDDCDDADASVNPDADEVCDGLDNDCDGLVDPSALCTCSGETWGDHSYYYCTTSADWATASAACAEVGYHLLTVNDEDENTWSDATARSYLESIWWMGFSDQVTEGTWIWEDGADPSYTNWASGEPNGGVGESCGQLNRFGDGTWNDEPCTTEYPFVCESPDVAASG